MSKELRDVADKFIDLTEIFNCPKEQCQHIGVKETGVQTSEGCICICGNPNCKKIIEYKCGDCGAFCLQPTCPIGERWRPKGIKYCDFDYEFRECSCGCKEFDNDKDEDPLVVPVGERKGLLRII